MSLLLSHTNYQVGGRLNNVCKCLCFLNESMHDFSSLRCVIYHPKLSSSSSVVERVLQSAATDSKCLIQCHSDFSVKVVDDVKSIYCGHLQSTVIHSFKLNGSELHVHLVQGEPYHTQVNAALVWDDRQRNKFPGE